VTLRPQLVVGLIGLGALGSALALRLRDQGCTVYAFDTAESACDRVAAIGGIVTRSAAETAMQAPVVVSCLPTVDALYAMTEGAGSITHGRPSGCLIDTSTFPLAAKRRAREHLSAAGWAMLDCSVSGNRPMVIAGEHTLFVSGAPSDVEACTKVLAALAPGWCAAGEFGNASLIKFIVNHLVIVNGAAAAEAMALARQAGLDLDTVYDLVLKSAGYSRMFEVRGRMMLADEYRSSLATYAALLKDCDIIRQFAADTGFSTPLLALANQMYAAAAMGGWADQDPASLGAALSEQLPLC
jgi:L-threonate 2-dehydrogenase